MRGKDDVDDGNEWITPKRKAIKQTEFKEAKEYANDSYSSNGYAALQAATNEEHALKVFRRYEVGDVTTEYREAKEAYCDNQAVNAGAIWDKLVVPKHRFIYWQIFNTHLLTRDHLQQIIVIPSNLCPVCDSALETHDHLFFTCTYAIQVFATVNKWMGSIQWPRSIAEMVLGCCNIKQNLTNRITNIVLAAALYFF
ncbi:hypothetical protein F8388_008855 [Cannabis sativa]|uniref:Reverse transcriptase zinc-binding domain-containing protein n=1 Tax=Cannabis sativa TaxID=3483 RepID=A0A7J6GWR0_CANSA|nr:hypothetical protein F8388_008855 [Cannabis sativa]